jgi:hypothetical protein
MRLLGGVDRLWMARWRRLVLSEDKAQRRHDLLSGLGGSEEAGT